MLKAHFDAIEAQLLATSKIPANAGHKLHRGTPREAFIREFLEGHLSKRVSIGTGEIIDATSQPREPRNQFDIVIYQNDYPRLDFGGGITGFLAESVIATIEVKSVLTEVDLAAAIRNAGRAKRLQRHFVEAYTAGYHPPGILSYVVAYDGPARLDTVYEWLKSAEAEQGLNAANLPPTALARQSVISDSLEGVVQLGAGRIFFDNSPVSLIRDDARQEYPAAKYTACVGNDGNLLYFFLSLVAAVSGGVTGRWADLTPYVGGVVAPTYLLE